MGMEFVPFSKFYLQTEKEVSRNDFQTSSRFRPRGLVGCLRPSPRNSDLLLFLAFCASIALFISVHNTMRRHRIVEPAQPLTLGALHQPQHHRGSTHKRWFNVSGGEDAARACTMASCFDFSKCQNGFKVHIHFSGEQRNSTKRFTDILTAVKRSRYYTDNPKEACLFIVMLDTLDRDKLSKDFGPNIDQILAKLPLWNHGSNHLMFVIYSGTWPKYTPSEFSFNSEKAIVAQASSSQPLHREGFDISFPLYYPTHAQVGGQAGLLDSTNIPAKRKYLMSFKGKRYVHGEGSDSRNALWMLHNSRDVISLTTCQHPGAPKELYDDRCEVDQQEYVKWDFNELLLNSTFCLLPRGRRLGTYRFLESLQLGCIPILLSDQYVLPFHEVIDWSRAVVYADERRLLEIPDQIRSISPQKIMEMQQQTQFLWNAYFSSTQKIIDTTLEIIAQRVANHFGRNTHNYYVWNNAPGALMSIREYSANLADYPFYISASDIKTKQVIHDAKLQHKLGAPSVVSSKYTAVIVSKTSVAGAQSKVAALIDRLTQSQHLHQILVLHLGTNAPKKTTVAERGPDRKVAAPVAAQVAAPIQVPKPSYNCTVTEINIKSLNERFYPFPQIRTEAVLSLDEHIGLTADQADYGFLIWKQFRERLVGFESRFHYWNKTNKAWTYSSRVANHYSIVPTSAAFYHKYYGYAFSNYLSQDILQISNRYGCEDILMNFLISDTTHSPPVRLLGYLRGLEDSFGEQAADICKGEAMDKTNTDLKMPPKQCLRKKESSIKHRVRQLCLTELVKSWGNMPLKTSEVRLNPQLYHDEVSNMRKKYRVIETMKSLF